MPRLGQLASALLLALAACSTATPEAFDRRMAAYVGRPGGGGVAALGVPSRTYDGDGRRLLQYEFARPSPTPAIFPSIGLASAAGAGAADGGSAPASA
jgi:hypothetical protein